MERARAKRRLAEQARRLAGHLSLEADREKMAQYADELEAQAARLDARANDSSVTEVQKQAQQQRQQGDAAAPVPPKPKPSRDDQT